MQVVNFFKNLSPTEIAIIVLILIVFFGTKLVTRLGRMGGETLKEMRKIKNNFVDTVEETISNKKEVSK